MLSWVGYTLCFVIIGLGAGLISKKYMPGRMPSGYATPTILGVAGALAGGVGWLALRWLGMGPELSAYAHVESADTQPANWIGLVFALAVSLLVLAIYKLTGDRKTHT